MFATLVVMLYGCSNSPTVEQNTSSIGNAEYSLEPQVDVADEQEAIILDAECMVTQPGLPKLACIQSACEEALEGSLLRQKCDAGVYNGEENIAREYGENFPDCALVQNADELDQCLSDFCKIAVANSSEKKTCDVGLYKQYFMEK